MRCEAGHGGAPLALVRLGKPGVEVQRLARVLYRVQVLLQLEPRLCPGYIQLGIARVVCDCLRRPARLSAKVQYIQATQSVTDQAKPLVQ